jgi:holin-like protein
MLSYIAMLLGFQLAGETLVKLSGLPVPGPVAGMAMLFAVLVIMRQHRFCG